MHQKQDFVKYIINKYTNYSQIDAFYTNGIITHIFPYFNGFCKKEQKTYAFKLSTSLFLSNFLI